MSDAQGADSIKLAARLQFLEKEVSELRAKLDRKDYKEPAVKQNVDDKSSTAVSSSPLTRRRLLGSIGAATLGVLAAQGLEGQMVAQAADGNSILAGETNTSSHATALAVNQDAGSVGYGFRVVDVSLSQFPLSASLAGHNNGTYDTAVLGCDQSKIGIGVHGVAVEGTGVKGEGQNTGVHGVGYEQGTGVMGKSETGSGVVGQAGTNTSKVSFQINAGTAGIGFEKAIGVVGIVAGQGVEGGAGVVGFVLNAHSDLPGVIGETLGTGPGVSGETEGVGPGVSGNSKLGRGVVAQGLLAQLRLTPSTKENHPATGLPGDLFVDASRRLWFCKQGGTKPKWVQLA